MKDIFTADFLLRLLALALLLSRHAYWFISERRSDREKPKSKPPTTAERRMRFGSLAMGLLICAQLAGLDILPFQASLPVQLVGFVAVVIGVAMSLPARKTLGTNWAHGAEYQIKPDQELVTGGVYGLVRHPIYAGILLSAIGAQLVAGSWLVIAFVIIGPIAAYRQALKEEALLTQQFGPRYKQYMTHTKRFLPYIW
jgi:protein-S-isoprenylcysteine O-methyltransferase Ste14